MLQPTCVLPYRALTQHLPSTSSNELRLLAPLHLPDLAPSRPSCTFNTLLQRLQAKASRYEHPGGCGTLPCGSQQLQRPPTLVLYAYAAGRRQVGVGQDGSRGSSCRAGAAVGVGGQVASRLRPTRRAARHAACHLRLGRAPALPCPPAY